MADLYAEFWALVASTKGLIQSPAGHRILIFDHHFFHLAAVERPPDKVLTMPRERSEILQTTDDVGRYRLAHGGSRARNLPSAFETMQSPDEVWMDNPVVATAKWVYVKQFESKPYAYTVALIGQRENQGGIIVPFSSFPCRSKDMRKWRQGNRIY